MSFLVGDQLGSASVTLWANGSVHGRLRYKPWGETRYTYATTPTGYRYTGQREDSLLKLYDYNARYYDPNIGRFLSADPMIPPPSESISLHGLTVSFSELFLLSRLHSERRGEVRDLAITGPSDPQTLNRYVYVGNNPVINIDPNGHHHDRVQVTLNNAQSIYLLASLIENYNLALESRSSTRSGWQGVWAGIGGAAGAIVVGMLVAGPIGALVAAIAGGITGYVVGGELADIIATDTFVFQDFQDISDQFIKLFL